MLSVALTISVDAQNKRTGQQRKTATSQKSAQRQTKKTATRKKTTKKKRSTQKAKTSQKKTPQPTVKGLQNQRKKLQRNIKEQERKLQANRNNVKKRLENLQIINSEIADKRRTIDTIRHDLTVLDDNISTLNTQMKILEQKLDERKKNYMQSMRYMHRNRSLQNQLMFVFSAKNFTQMYRRLRFSREYAQYQRAQGEAVIQLKEQVSQAASELNTTKRQKNDLLNRGEAERKNLEGKQVEQQKVVKSLQKQQKTIESLISEQRKKDIALNAQIDKLIAEEVARAKARAEAEARAEAKRQAEAAAAKKRAEEKARKEAAANAAARERARRNAERGTADKPKVSKKEVAEVTTPSRMPSMRKTKRTSERTKKPATFSVSSEDRRLSGNFESNRGRLPMPITGGYRIISGFGQHDVEGLRGVRLDNKGINIKGQAGAQARSIFDGEVCAVFNIGGVMGVMVRHGSYISVYSNLSSVSVRRGQHVSTRQALGSIGSEGVLQFQLRKGTAVQNPSRWLSR